MITLEVKNGKIITHIKQDSFTPIYEELGQGILELLVEFQANLIKNGNPEEKVKAAYLEMMTTIQINNDATVKHRLSEINQRK